MNQLQNQAEKCPFPQGQSPSKILWAVLQTAAVSSSFCVHPAPVITGIPSLKSICPTGKTLEEGVGGQGLGEEWQLWGAMKQLAVLGATGNGDWHHVLRRMGIKTRMDGS